MSVAGLAVAFRARLRADDVTRQPVSSPCLGRPQLMFPAFSIAADGACVLSAPFHTTTDRGRPVLVTNRLPFAPWRHLPLARAGRAGRQRLSEHFAVYDDVFLYIVLDVRIQKCYSLRRQ